MIGIVIPALDPPDTLISFVNELRSKSSKTVKNVVVVNDGSSDSSGFRALEGMKHVVVLHHDENKGKGAALKTGFRYLLSDDTVTSIVTADADGQHLAEDVVGVCAAAESNPQALTLGARTKKSGIPIKSAVGNRLTRTILNLAFGIDANDSQTGLRAIPRKLAERCLAVESTRYAFELDMLLLADSMGITLKEVAITTIYIDGNRASHFRTIRDSVNVYLVFLRYSSTSLISFWIDIVLFAFLHYYTGTILLSTYVARVSSGAFNFIGNRQIVFHNRARSSLIRDAAAYAGLAFLIATASGYAVQILSGWTEWTPVFVKLGVDSCLFFVSFTVQRYVIFKPDKMRSQMHRT